MYTVPTCAPTTCTLGSASDLYGVLSSTATTMPSGYGNTGSLKSITSLRCTVISIAAEMMSILLLVSDGISAEKGVAWTLILKPASSPIAVIRSTIAPWMVLVLTSRNVNGMPVGVEPTL